MEKRLYVVTIKGENQEGTIQAMKELGFVHAESYEWKVPEGKLICGEVPEDKKEEILQIPGVDHMTPEDKVDPMLQYYVRCDCPEHAETD